LNTVTVTGVSEFSDWGIGAALAPTAASVNLAGRIVNQNNRGVSGAQVVLIDQNGTVRYARTNPFGYYRFAEVAAGQTVIVNVRHKRLTFAPRIITVTEDMTELNFALQ
jgi:hypothetical protein